jgi:hypothetical protein
LLTPAVKAGASTPNAQKQFRGTRSPASHPSRPKAGLPGTPDEGRGFHPIHPANSTLFSAYCPGQYLDECGEKRCRRLGRMPEARASYEKALALVRQEPERRLLAKRLEELK